MAASLKTQRRHFRNNLTAKYVRSILSYSKKTGILRWKYRPNQSPQWNGKNVGKAAGWKNSSNGFSIKIDKMDYHIAIIIWAIVTGKFPKYEIDHKNRKRFDNRWNNLREATHAQNGRNKSVYKNNTSGCIGVTQNKRTRKWCARIGINYQRIWIGTFPTKEEAKAARKKAIKKIHGKFAYV